MRASVLLIVGAFGIGSPALARADCHAGDVLLEAGDAPAAIRAYEAAAARPECAAALPAIRINEGYARESVARASKRPEDHCAALYAWRRALPGASARAATAIEASIAAMEAGCVHPARIIVQCEPPGATVRIEGLGEPRPCPARFEGVPPGRYAGAAVAAGVETPFEVEARAGETTRQTLHLAPAGRDGPPPTAPAPGLSAEAPPPPAGADLTPYAWTATGLAVAAAGVAIYGLSLQSAAAEDADALNADADAFNADVASLGEDSANRADLRARAADIERDHARIEADHSTARDVTLGASIAAGAFAVAAVALFVFDDAPATTTGAVRLGPGALSVSF